MTFGFLAKSLSDEELLLSALEKTKKKQL